MEVDPETLAADAYAQQDAAAREYRRRAALAIQVGDWPAFFTAAADCARAMNSRGRIVDAAPVVGSAPRVAPVERIAYGEESPAPAA